jgi:L-alanine-DL-glutamate epimerase-like enolase superfamily enzyme
MRLHLRRFRLTKAVPLAISRGTTAAVDHLLLELEHEGITGRGETGGFDTGHRRFETDDLELELASVLPHLQGLEPEPLQALEPLLAPLSPPARCALDLALLDWQGKRLGQPLQRLWGLDPGRTLPTRASHTRSISVRPGSSSRTRGQRPSSPSTGVTGRLPGSL